MNLATVKAKECKACGKSFLPSNGERGHVWKARKYCCQPCSAKGRRMQSDKWRAEVTKVCWVCDQVFRPAPGMVWGAWLRKSICDRFCEAAIRKGRRVVVADPLDQVTPQQRLKWLRLSASQCGKKVPWSLEIMGEGCAVSDSVLWKIECGGGVSGDWIPAAAARLRVPADLFTCSVKKFAAVVNAAGLSAKLSVPKEERRAA
jgi:hypothetical protein